MRGALLALALLALALLAPLASAALEPEAARILEAPVEEGAATFALPFRVTEASLAYAKVLPTPGNAVNDGSGPNGTWSVAFALERADGAREEMGAFANGSASRAVPLAAGERATLVVAVRAPATHAGEARVMVALAARPADAALAQESGGRMDEARAFTLVLAAPAGPAAPTPDVAPLPDDGGEPPAVQEGPDDPEPRGGAPWALLLGLGALALAGAAFAVVRYRR